MVNVKKDLTTLIQLMYFFFLIIYISSPQLARLDSASLYFESASRMATAEGISTLSVDETKR